MCVLCLILYEVLRIVYEDEVEAVWLLISVVMKMMMMLVVCFGHMLNTMLVVA